MFLKVTLGGEMTYQWSNEYKNLKKAVASVLIAAFATVFILTDAWTVVGETDLAYSSPKYANLDVASTASELYQ